MAELRRGQARTEAEPVQPFDPAIESFRNAQRHAADERASVDAHSETSTITEPSPPYAPPDSGRMDEATGRGRWG